MVAITLDKSLLTKLIADHVGGVSNLLDRWYEHAVAAGHPDPEDAVPDRSTIYRWRDGQLPRSSDDLLILCGLLDVDPLAVLALPKGRERAALQALYFGFWVGQWKQPGLSFLRQFFGHHLIWPPPTIGDHSFHRPWQTAEFSHTPTERSNVYALLEVSGEVHVYADRPQVFHFAYQQPSHFGQRWIQYGFVVRHRSSIRLLNITSDIQTYDADDIGAPSHVETWFGPMATNFRVASLHELKVHIAAFDAKTPSKVTFFP